VASAVVREGRATQVQQEGPAWGGGRWRSRPVAVDRRAKEKGAKGHMATVVLYMGRMVLPRKFWRESCGGDADADDADDAHRRARLAPWWTAACPSEGAGAGPWWP